MTDIRNTLKMLGRYGLTTIERVLLSSKGTVQTLLSVIHNHPVKVKVISQLNYGNVLVRWARLYAEDSIPFTTVALAESVIPYELNRADFIAILSGSSRDRLAVCDKNRADFISEMGDRDIGIGQALQMLGISTEREILGIHVDAETIARSYRITGDEIDILITETFQRSSLRKHHGIQS